MPPLNHVRRNHLTDTALRLLAREGARGLTHRAVDAAAGEPLGTTSRYFRTRDALLRAAADRARALHVADLAAAPREPAGVATVADHLAAMVHAALTTERDRHLAVLELFLESTRRPAIRAALVEARRAQIALIRDIHRAAGVELSEEAAAGLVMSITGVYLTALSTPEAVGMKTPEDVRDLVRATILGRDS